VRERGKQREEINRTEDVVEQEWEKS